MSLSAVADLPETRASTELKDPLDFSIVQGGALYQVLLRTRLEKPSLELLARRTLVITVIVWVPLLLLSVIAGRAWGGVKIPFLFDFAAQIRFLVCLPLLLYAETVAHERLRPIIGQFLLRSLVRPEDEAKFGSIIQSSIRWRDSVWVEVGLLVIVLTMGQFTWRSYTAQSTTWYADGGNLTLPGRYFAYVSVPIFQFIVLRWYFRILIWTQALFRISRLNLRLIPTHADRMGGLGFLQGSDSALIPLVLAHSFLVAGVLANRIIHDGARLPMFKIEIIFTVAFLLLIVLAPLLAFTPMLVNCRRIGMLEYGRLASRYVDEFDRKWLRNKEAPEDALLGSADLQSLADLGNSYEIIREMQAFPFGRPTVIRLAVVSILPLAPLVLTMVPFEELLSRTVKMLL